MRRAAIVTLLFALAACAAPRGEGVPVAVLGDSDSHSYRDSVNHIARGGANNAKTFNWLEVWERLRPNDIDPGPFARAGANRTLARLEGLAGLPTRTPAKLDYLYNYAWSGARCSGLSDDWPEQASRFLTRVRAAPTRWADGLVVIRIGVNDFGQGEHLRVWAKTPEAATPLVDACLREIGETVAAIRGLSRVRIALVGIARDYNAPFADETVVATADIANAEAPLARFDDGLKALAAGDPRIAFIDDESWFTARFGSRAKGTLADTISVAGVEVANAVGDAPIFLHTADGHAGTIASGLFLQHFIRQLNERFGWTLAVPTDEEIVALAR